MKYVKLGMTAVALAAAAFLISTAVAGAQPSPMRVEPYKPAAMKPAPKPAAMPVPAASPSASQPKPAAMTEAPAMTPASPPAMAPAAPAMKPEPAKTKDETAAKWINLLGPGLIFLILLILGAAGAKKYLQHERAKSILTGVRDGVKSWYTHAQGTPQKWDDAVAKLLLDLSDKLIAEGKPPLSEAEKGKAKLAAEANKKIIGPDQPKE